MTGKLRLACLDAEAPPLFTLWTPENGRDGYEPGVAAALGAELGREVEWVRVPWVDMIPAVQRGDADAVLCGQGITAERQAQVDFTRPYAIFHEGVLIRRGDDIHSAEDLVGRKVAAIENSTNMTLAQTFTGAEPVAFGAGSDDVYADMLAALLAKRRVRKIICSFPRQADSHHFDALYRAGDIELELVPQGNLAERIRAAGAGIGGFFTPTGYGTQLAEGKEVREIDGTHYVLEAPIRGDVALIKAYAADRHGNLVYRKTARNFGPVMAAAAATTIVQVDEVREEPIDPEHVVTPGIYTDTVVRIGWPFCPYRSQKTVGAARGVRVRPISAARAISFSFGAPT